MSPPRACSWKIALKYNVKQLNQNFNGKFTSYDKASPIKLETHISLPRYAPPKVSPLKRAFENINLRAYIFRILWYFLLKGEITFEVVTFRALLFFSGGSQYFQNLQTPN